MAEYLAYYQARVPGLYQDGGEYRAKCPLHAGETDNSFSLDPQTWRWYCFGACKVGGDAIELEMKLDGVKFAEAKRAVEDLLGIIPADLAAPPKRKRDWGKLVATYDYQNADGGLHMQVCRFEPKDFRQRRPDPDNAGKWIWSVKGIEPLLYHLPELLAGAGTVYLCEGEKDADNAREHWHVNATTCPMGAGKFTAAMARSIAGRDVVLIQDNDEAGRKHAEKCARLLKLEGCRVKILTPPAPHKDTSDWIAAGGTREHLLEMQRSVSEWAPGAIAEPDEEPAANPHEGAPGLPATIQEMLENYVIVVGTSDVFCKRTWRFMGKEQVRHAHEAIYTAWAKDPSVQKLDADRIVFKPQGTLSSELNLFKGLPIEPDASKPHARIIEHVANLMGGDPDLTRWITCWLAYPLQHPGAKMRTSLVVYGLQGTGKSLLFEDTMRAIYGPYHDVVGQYELDSQYGGWASQKLFVVGDEVSADRRNTKVRNRLKMLITGETIGIEEKYASRRTEENHMNLVLLSNEDRPVQLEPGDRRYTIVRCDRLQLPEYFEALGAELADGGAAGFLHYLMTFDLGDFNPYTPPYETAAKGQLAIDCADSTQRFFSAWFESELPVGFRTAATTDLYEAYKLWCLEAGERVEMATERKFLHEVAARLPTRRTRWSNQQRTVAIVGDDPNSANVEAGQFRSELDKWIESYHRRRVS